MRDRQIDLDATLDALASMTLRVARCRRRRHQPERHDGRPHGAPARALDDGGHRSVPIMSYSTKFASALLWAVPHRRQARRRATASREHYQIDVRSRTDAIGSSVRCANEGADLLMVKPGMTSLDLIMPIREATGKLVGAYQVSGEYAGLCALGRAGLADFDAALLETWQVFRRAGAAYIITYGARRAPFAGSAACDRSRAVVRPRVEGRAGRRAESGSRIPVGRRHADLHRAAPKGPG